MAATPFYSAQAAGSVDVACLGSHHPADGSFGNLKSFASIADTLAKNCGDIASASTVQASASTAGILRVFATTTGAGGTSAGASVQMATGLTFLAPQGFNGSSVSVIEQLVVTGSASGRYTGSAAMGVGSFTDGFFYFDKQVSGGFSSDFNAPHDPNFTLSLSIDVPVDASGRAYFVLTQSLGVSVIPDCIGCTSMADLSHTARAVQILPPGWTFASDSGDFLVATPAVPEPPGVWLMALGLAGIVMLRRRKP